MLFRQGIPLGHIKVAHFLQVIVEEAHGQVVETVLADFMRERLGGEDAVSVPKMADGEHLEGGPNSGFSDRARVAVPGRPRNHSLPVKTWRGDVGQDDGVPGLQGEGGK